MTFADRVNALSRDQAALTELESAMTSAAPQLGLPPAVSLPLVGAAMAGAANVPAQLRHFALTTGGRIPPALDRLMEDADFQENVNVATLAYVIWRGLLALAQRDGGMATLLLPANPAACILLLAHAIGLDAADAWDARTRMLLGTEGDLVPLAAVQAWLVQQQQAQMAAAVRGPFGGGGAGSSSTPDYNSMSIERAIAIYNSRS